MLTEKQSHRKSGLKFFSSLRALNDSRKKSIYVQYSQLDSSGQNLDSKGDWSKNETGEVHSSPVELPEV